MQKSLESDWLKAMQLIRYCTSEMREKLVIVIGLVIFAMQKVVIVCDWIISAEADSNSLDFQAPSSIFKTFTFSLQPDLMARSCLYTGMCLT